MIKRVIAAIITALAIALPMTAQTTTETLFPIPTPPAEIEGFTERVDWILEHYWERCNIKSALSSRQKFANTIDTYLTEFVPNGSRRAAMRSIHTFLASLEKHPAELLFVGERAEAMLYSDTAVIASDEAYLPFARAIAENKKIDRASKARFAEQARILGQSSVGMTAPDLVYTDAAGESHSLAADTAAYVIVFFNDPDCLDCMIARGRLSANPTINNLIAGGVLKIVAITPDEMTDEWREGSNLYPDNWSAGVAPDAYDTFDIRATPTFYILDKDHHILGKNVPLDQILNLFNAL